MLIYRRVERLADPDDIVLDLGTKDGRYLTDVPGTVIGVDIEFKFPLKEGASYLYGDGRRLPFKDNSFDYVVLNQVLEHVDGREEIVSEVARVLKPNGEALFSFPNRMAMSKPHGLPRWLSAVPKPAGKPLALRLLDQEDYEYYRDGVFPLSPIGARQLFSQYFGSISYRTVEESVENTDIYGSSTPSSIFAIAVPYIALAMRFPPFAWMFETVWSYSGYSCTLPKKSG